MELTTVTVTGQLNLPNGDPAAFAPVRFTLSALGVAGLALVMPRHADAVCNAGGAFVAQVVPSPPGTFYSVTASQRGALPFFTAKVVVPASACQLTQIMQTLPAPPVDASQQALIDLQAAQAEVEADRQDAEASASSAAQSAQLTGQDRIATGEDRFATGLDRTATGLDRAATDQDREQTGEDRTATGEDRFATGQDRTATGQDCAATGQDRVQTGLDRVQTGLDRVQTGLDRVRAAADKAAASISAGQSAGSAASALAIYGSAAAMQAKLDEAKVQSAAAQTAAASASSVLQQDLSAISAALHRSPNAITAMCIYDLGKDSDGGAWADRMQHTSWYNEPLNGAWRGQVASEAAARAISGAVTGDYYQLSTDGKFYKLNAGAGTTEVFRGNKAKFPRLAAAVAEANNVTIYDLTEPARPMWMRFAGTAASWPSTAFLWLSATGLSAVNGSLAVSSSDSNGGGITLISFPVDKATRYASTLSAGPHSATIANRNALGRFLGGNTSTLIVNNTAYAVAMTVLPDAPVDATTGLQVPTIAVLTPSATSVIRHDGTVSSELISVSGPVYDGLGIGGSILFYSASGTSARVRYADLAKITSPTFATIPLDAVDRFYGGVFSGRLLTVAKSLLGGATYSASELHFHRPNRRLTSAGLTADVTDKYGTGFLVGDIRRAYLCNTEVESVSGTELVVNGAFDTDTTGWAAAAGSDITVVAGALRVTNTTAVYGYASQALTTVAGKTYAVRVQRVGGTGGGFTHIGFGPGNSSIVSSNLTGAFNFTAIGATTYISLLNSPNTAGLYYDFDNVSVKEVVADRSYKAAGASIFGTLVKSQVAPAAQLVAWSSFSAVNYIQEPYSADLDFGVGEWSVGAWVSYTTAAAAVIAERSAASGPYFKLGTDATGKLVATAYDGTTTRIVTTTAAYNTGVYTRATANYKSGKLWIEVNGVEVASATGAALLTMNNAAAVFAMGQSRTLDAPFPGSLCLIKPGATVPTAEQSVWMYEQEKQMFRDGAQITLPAATAVTDLAYDESQDKWVAVQAGYESSFTGLVRTAAAVPSAGSFAKVEAKGGVKLLARTTTSPGVDVTIPAYGLREELVRRAEAAAKLSRTLTVFDFNAIAAQTDFVLPAGWTATEVMSAGASQREGATKAWTRLFDGFRETVKFAVAPGAAVWVQITARKE